MIDSRAEKFCDSSFIISWVCHIRAPTGFLLAPGGVYPWGEPLAVAVVGRVAAFRGGEIDKAAAAPVAGGGEEDEQEEGAVDAGAVEEVGGEEEEGQMEGREGEGERKEKEGDVTVLRRRLARLIG